MDLHGVGTRAYTFVHPRNFTVNPNKKATDGVGSLSQFYLAREVGISLLSRFHRLALGKTFGFSQPFLSQRKLLFSPFPVRSPPTPKHKNNTA